MFKSKGEEMVTMRASQDILLPSWRAHATEYKRDCLRRAGAGAGTKRQARLTTKSIFEIPPSPSELAGTPHPSGQSRDRYLNGVWDARDDVTSAQNGVV